MNMVDRIKTLFIKLPDEARIIISDDMIKKYQATCNHGLDDDVNATKKIIKSLSLGKIVYQKDNKTYIKYFDMLYKIDGNKLYNLYRDRRNKYPYCPVDELIKKKWDKVFGIKKVR